MAVTSYDGQSLLLGGRRIWLVSGTIDYARTPHQLWRSRIRSARQAGLNCIQTACPWLLHEPNPKKFNFKDDLNIRSFIETVGQEGMHCILRVGPYIGDTWDLGGLPGWLLADPSIKLREANPGYLEACGRYLSALLNQVKDLQVNANSLLIESTTGEITAPIIMVQSENQWTCDNPDAAHAYLHEIVRYLREHGCTVPICESNNLWAMTERTIACWAGSEHLAADLRQLQQIQPNAPRIVADLITGHPGLYGSEPHNPSTPDQLLQQLASVLAVGGQYCVSPFHGGSNFGFTAGRLIDSFNAQVTTSNDRGAPLSEAGQPSPSYAALKRISTFASQFDQLFAHLEPNNQHATALPHNDQKGISIFHQRGSQGQVVFLFQPKGKKGDTAEILLSDGLTLPVPIGTDKVAWFVVDVSLGGTARLDHTNLRPWALINKQLLILFGPAGADGYVSINGHSIHLTVPTGKTPFVEICDDITVAVLNTEQIDSAYLLPDACVYGAAGLDANDEPIPLKDAKSYTTIALEGSTKRRNISTPATKVTTPRLTGWKQAPTTDYLTGDSDQFKPIDNPASLEQLGVHNGYGWYRITCKSGERANIFPPPSGGRTHLFHKAKPVATTGLPTDQGIEPVELQTAGTLVALCGNTPRLTHGWRHGEPQGITSHLYAVKKTSITPLKMGRAQPPELFDLRAFFPHAIKGMRGATRFYNWPIKPVGSNPIYIQITGLPARVILSVNDELIGAYDPIQSAGYQCFTLLPGEQLRRGNNTAQLSLLESEETDSELDRKLLTKHVTVYQGTKNLTSRASWAYAPLTLPDDEQFKPIPTKLSPEPRWFTCNFTTKNDDTPLWFEPAGLTTGQIYLNDLHVGRYTIADHDGKPIPGQSRYYLPEPWLHTDQPNKLVIFDEHGHSPATCSLARFL